MESNQKLMILSLLNLYTSYVDLKSKSTEIPSNKQNNTFSNRYGTKRFQTNKSLNTQFQNSDKNVPATTKVSTGIQKVQEKTNDQRESTAHYTSLKYPISSGTITFVTDEKGESLADKKETTAHYASSQYPTPSGTITVITDDKEESVTECYIDTEQNIVIDPALIANISNNYTIIADATDSAAVTEKTKPVKRRRRGKNKTDDDGNRLPRVRRWRTRPINIDRALTGYHRKVFSTIKQMDNQQFFEHTRMSKSLFDWLLTFVQSSLRKKRQTIYPEERLAITLNYLAFGTSLQSIAFKHKVGKSTVRQIVLDTCSVLWDLLSPIYLSAPTTSQYAEIAKYIKNKWDIPNCVGAADGRNASIRDPSKTAPNHNRITLNIPIYAICDTKYKFLAASVGNLDKRNADGIFQLSPQNNVIISDNLPLPLNKFISPLSPSLPHYFISNTSFPLRKNIMCPYAETNLEPKENVFNYKMSCVSSFIDNTFGILTARFRVLLTTIEFLPENCKTVILACIALHNFIMANDEEQLYCPANFVDRESAIGIVEEGEWRNELKNNGDQPLPSIISNETRATIEAKNMRNTLSNLFESEIISFDIRFA